MFIMNRPLLVAAISATLIVVSCSTNPSGPLRSASNGQASMNTGRDCIQCHATGSENGAFTIAGSLYAADFSTSAPNGTVYLYTDTNGTGTLRYTLPVDGKGNFYTNDAINFGAGLYPAVRSSDASKPVRYMGSSIMTGACNSCHNGTAQDRIAVQ
jgi:hypothetical protein